MVTGIDGDHAGVALKDAHTRGHSGRLVVGAVAAPGLGEIARQLNAVGRRPLTTDQTLFVADKKYLGEDAGDVFAQWRNKYDNEGNVLACAK